MINHLSQPPPAPMLLTPASVFTYDRKRIWFAYALPALMAVLLALVPVIGTSARVPFMLSLLPLIAWFALTDTERGIYVYIAWCWMDFTIRGLFGAPPLLIVARDIVLGVIVVGWAFQRMGTRIQDPLRVPPGSLLITLFIINCFVQLLNPNAVSLLQSLGGLKIHLSPIPLFFIGYDVFRRRDQVRSLFLFLTLSTFVISIVSIVQYMHGMDWTFAHFPGSSEAISTHFNPPNGTVVLKRDDYFKPPGTTGFGGNTAAFAGFISPFTFALFLLSGRLRFNLGMKALFGTVLFGFVVTFFVNGLRSALVEAALCILACSIFVGGRARTRALMAACVCVVLGMAGFAYSQSVSHGVTDRFSSLFANPQQALQGDRKSFFDQAGELALNAPFGIGLGRTGAGAGHFGKSTERIGFSAFSEAYLGNMILETGIIGALLIALVSLSFIVRGGMIMKNVQDTDDKLVVSALFSIMFVLFLNFFVASVLVQPPGSVLFWLLGATLLRVYGRLPATRPGIALAGEQTRKAEEAT